MALKEQNTKAQMFSALLFALSLLRLTVINSIYWESKRTAGPVLHAIVTASYDICAPQCIAQTRTILHSSVPHSTLWLQM